MVISQRQMCHTSLQGNLQLVSFVLNSRRPRMLIYHSLNGAERNRESEVIFDNLMTVLNRTLDRLQFWVIYSFNELEIQITAYQEVIVLSTQWAGSKQCVP